jgi:hypothetical protein
VSSSILPAPEQLAAIDRRREQLAVESRGEFVSTVVELDLSADR